MSRNVIGISDKQWDFTLCSRVVSKTKTEHGDIDFVHYIWKNLGSLSFTYWNVDENTFCCFEHEVQNNLSLCYENSRKVLRCER